MGRIKLELETTVEIEVKDDNVFKAIQKSKSSFFDKSSNTVKASFFENSKKVPNVYRGLLIKNNSGKYEFKKHRYKCSFIDSNFDDYCISVDKDIPSIVLILESPHRDEYGDNFEPKAPAQGDTGEGIINYIEMILTTLINDNSNCIDNTIEKYRIILVNPVPFQTSLFEIHGLGINSSLKNKVWRKCWKENKAEFIKIVKDINPKIILNGCTYSLKSNVKTALKKEKLEGLNYFEIDHPCVWNDSTNAIKEQL